MTHIFFFYCNSPPIYLHLLPHSFLPRCSSYLFRASLGVVQMRRMPEIVSWKQRYAREVLDLRYPNRVQMPNGMESGYYKYIVFDEIPQTTGRVYELPCHEIFDSSISLPNTEWATNNHWCVPIYYPK